MRKTTRGVLLAIFLFGGIGPLLSQHVPTHIANEGIYTFLDELASDHHIDLWSLVKPYSRRTIARLLEEAEGSREELNGRQLAELDFYLMDYAKEGAGDASWSDRPAANWLWQSKYKNKRADLFYYRDTLFQITVNPIVGSDVWVNQNGSFSHWWNGVEAWAYAGGFGLWASLRDNHESTELTARDFQNRRIGAANIKGTGGDGRDYEEFRGGITYGWRWGNVGLVMDQVAWGENNAGANIFSGRTPSYPMLELNLQPVSWFRFHYMHGFLTSEVVDSTKSFVINNAYGTRTRSVYHSKYIAANMFSFTPVPRLQLSVGNSIVYDYQSPSAAYLIPVAFYKAIDHNLNARNENMNSQLFFSLSSRNLKHFHFHGTIFLDELAMGRIAVADEHNFVSYKAGLSSTMVPNMRVVAEYTWTNALTFMHYVPTTTFESNQYNLGHFLEDNAKELYLAAEYSLWRTLRVKAFMNRSLKGPDHTGLGTTPRMTITPFEPVVWESLRVGLFASAQLVNDLYVRMGYEWRNVTGEQPYLDRWTPEVYHGETGTFRLGINFGF
ncbi:MAG: hypothetical protein ABFS10_13145 [Bacteroidota bacterium]